MPGLWQPCPFQDATVLSLHHILYEGMPPIFCLLYMAVNDRMMGRGKLNTQDFASRLLPLSIFPPSSLPSTQPARCSHCQTFLSFCHHHLALTCLHRHTMQLPPLPTSFPSCSHALAYTTPPFSFVFAFAPLCTFTQPHCQYHQHLP
jgi:hypothetical protein